MRSPCSLRALGFAASLACACTSSVEGGGGLAGQPDAMSQVIPALADAAPVVVPDAEPAVAPCVEGDNQLSNPADGTCYFLLATPQTWTTALAACLSLGGRLLVIESAEEQTLVATLAAQYPQGAPDLWLGATDVLVEGTFVWANTLPVVYTNWRAGEPNNNGGNGLPENCMIIEGDNPAAEWDDRKCADTFPAICERL